MNGKVQIFLEKYHMIEENDHIIAGFSGGADSVCLLLVLKELQERLPFSLTAVHVEHGIRGQEGRDDAVFAREFCEREQIPFCICEVDAPEMAAREHLSLETAARMLRYRCLTRICQERKGTRIALAHHANDCAETVLFHMSRGSGLRGLGGIAPVRTEQDGRGGAAYPVIRPLLCLTRAEIEECLRQRGQKYRTDSTNSDMAYSRNRIRSRIIPELLELNPRAVQHMARAAREIGEAWEYLDKAAWEAGKECLLFSYAGDDLQEIVILCEPFQKISPVLQNILIHRLIGELSGSSRDIGAGHVERVRELLSGNTGRCVSLPGELTAVREYGTVRLERADMHTLIKPVQPVPKELKIPGEIFCGNDVCIRAKIRLFDKKCQEIPQKTYTKWFDYDKIKYTVQARYCREGDYFQTNAAGGHKKLKKFFSDAKIPRREREQTLLLADGSHILWIIGHRISEAYKVTPETRRVLCVCVERRNDGDGRDDPGDDQRAGD